MFQHILVPLDGSSLAEQAVPIAARIARKMHSSIVLLRVSSLNIEYGPYFSQAGLMRGAMIEDELARAQSYLENIAQSQLLAGIDTSIATVPGIPTISILSYVDANAIDLVIMGSHGWSGLKCWVLGSVTSHITRHCAAPVLVVREDQQLCQDESAPLRVLVALDGSPFAEAILEPAITLTSALVAPYQGTLHLTQLVQLPTCEDELIYMQTNLDLDEVRKATVLAAGQYLQAIVARLQDGLASQLKVNITWTTEECEDVATTLLQIAAHGDASGKDTGCNLLALTTHGRNFLQRWAVGSVADRVLHENQLPLLIIHPAHVSAEKKALV
ncbi:universal stress protein UspA [Dictyobacter vulcani]|uniref:Universal stress protein UspA n=1 Tax=Dictyobacter vulcani TaxID=2607529 RepID=A0A5J4KW14_9CHLR|nr:universal stress protein [Dictyobacter vulcani]GER90671.1 universal stress protein UspA [Dictyobacter vulcani]